MLRCIRILHVPQRQYLWCTSHVQSKHTVISRGLKSSTPTTVSCPTTLSSPHQITISKPRQRFHLSCDQQTAPIFFQQQRYTNSDPINRDNDNASPYHSREQYSEHNTDKFNKYNDEDEDDEGWTGGALWWMDSQPSGHSDQQQSDAEKEQVQLLALRLGWQAFMYGTAAAVGVFIICVAALMYVLDVWSIDDVQDRFLESAVENGSPEFKESGNDT